MAESWTISDSHYSFQEMDFGLASVEDNRSCSPAEAEDENNILKAHDMIVSCRKLWSPMSWVPVFHVFLSASVPAF